MSEGRVQACANWPNLSTNPAEYTLQGIASGYEFHGSNSVVGVTTNNLKISTEYTPLPPTTTTGEAAEVKQTEAKLQGSVNPNGSDTHAFFEYGTTTSYGSKVPAPPGWDIGGGTTFIPAFQTISGLEPGVTYHYRMVGSNVSGVIPGEDKTFTTRGGTAPAAVLEAGVGQQWVYYQTAQRNIEGLYWNAGAGTWSAFDQWATAPPTAPGTSAAAVLEAGAGRQWVYYQTAQGNIEGLYWNAPGGAWSAFDQWLTAPAAAPGTSPSVVRESVNGRQWVFYQTAQHTIEGLYWNAPAGTWSVFNQWPTAPAAAPGTSPSVVRESANGQMWVYYKTAQGNIEGLYWNASAGTWSAFDQWASAPAAAPGTSPTAVYDQSTGKQWIYYQTAAGNIDGLYWNAAGAWSVFNMWPSAPAAAPGTSPTVVLDASTTSQWVYYQTAQGAIEGLYWNAPGGTWSVFNDVA